MNTEQLTKRVADKLGVPERVLEEILRSEFKFILDHFKVRDPKAINLIHLGKFLKNKKYDEFGNKIRRNFSGLEKPDIQE